MSYWVVGGVYENTDFKDLMEGYDLERYGPFNSYGEAKEEWDKILIRCVSEDILGCFEKVSC